MAIMNLMDTSKNESKAVEDEKVKKTGKYFYVDTANEGIKKVVSSQGGYLAFLDYGRKYKPNRKTGQLEWKQDKTIKRVDTVKEAKRLRREAEAIREGGEAFANKPRKILFSRAVEEYKTTAQWIDSTDSAKDHEDNYFRHMNDYFANMEPRNITRIDVENYFLWQLDRGNRSTAKKNKDGSINKKEGISVNTLSKHKSAMKKLWQYFVDSKKYGVKENVVISAKLPKVEINIDGKIKKVSKIKYHPVSLTLDELNYTLNDAAQNEFDRSVLVMIALASIGSLRHSETLGLRLGKFLHNEYMSVSDDALNYGGFDRGYYEKHSELMLIDTAIMHIGSKDVEKLPKGEWIRVSAVPNCLKEIVDYAMEQRKEIYSIIGKEMDSNENLYLPLINIIRGNHLNGQKLSRKWHEYQVRRNKRMEKAGLEPIHMIRYHDLRHTHSNLLKKSVQLWEISYNMGHVIPGEVSDTTNRVYWNDRQPDRENIINYFDSNIKIDWDKALHKSVNEKGSAVKVNGSGHLIISSKETERRKAQGKKFIYKEEELEELFLQSE